MICPDSRGPDLVPRFTRSRAPRAGRGRGRRRAGDRRRPASVGTRCRPGAGRCSTTHSSSWHHRLAGGDGDAEGVAGHDDLAAARPTAPRGRCPTTSPSTISDAAGRSSRSASAFGSPPTTTSPAGRTAASSRGVEDRRRPSTSADGAVEGADPLRRVEVGGIDPAVDDRVGERGVRGGDERGVGAAVAGRRGGRAGRRRRGRRRRQRRRAPRRRRARRRRRSAGALLQRGTGQRVVERRPARVADGRRQKPGPRAAQAGVPGQPPRGVASRARAPRRASRVRPASRARAAGQASSRTRSRSRTATRRVGRAAGAVQPAVLVVQVVVRARPAPLDDREPVEHADGGEHLPRQARLPTRGAARRAGRRRPAAGAARRRAASARPRGPARRRRRGGRARPAIARRRGAGAQLGDQRRAPPRPAAPGPARPRRRPPNARRRRAAPGGRAARRARRARRRAGPAAGARRRGRRRAGRAARAPRPGRRRPEREQDARGPGHGAPVGERDGQGAQLVDAARHGVGGGLQRGVHRPPPGGGPVARRAAGRPARRRRAGRTPSSASSAAAS